MNSKSAADVLSALWLRCMAGLDSLRFQSLRGDYYEFLSALMAGTKGQRTLRSVFEQDAQRYAGTVRGRLSRAWSRAYATTGGDLYATWFGCFPSGELTIIRVAQLAGNETLMRTLHDLSQALALVKRSKNIAWTSLWSALTALSVLAAMMILVPLFTVPRLRRIFYILPHEYLGRWTERLFALADVIGVWWPVWLSAFALGLMVLIWSIPNLVGPLRTLLDRVSVWRIYRCVHALRFLSVLAVVLNRHAAASSTQLRTALSLLASDTSAWMRWHVNQMLHRIDQGLVGAQTFDTGLLDPELYWYLQDMSDVRGVVQALGLLRDRLDERVLVQVARQAQTLRWLLLISCVAGMLALGLWHYVVIDELRRSLMVFYASH